MCRYLHHVMLKVIHLYCTSVSPLGLLSYRQCTKIYWNIVLNYVISSFLSSFFVINLLFLHWIDLQPSRATKRATALSDREIKSLLDYTASGSLASLVAYFHNETHGGGYLCHGWEGIGGKALWLWLPEVQIEPRHGGERDCCLPPKPCCRVAAGQPWPSLYFRLMWKKRNVREPDAVVWDS